MSFVFPGRALCNPGSWDIVLTRFSFDDDENAVIVILPVAGEAVVEEAGE